MVMVVQPMKLAIGSGYGTYLFSNVGQPETRLTLPITKASLLVKAPYAVVIDRGFVASASLPALIQVRRPNMDSSRSIRWQAMGPLSFVGSFFDHDAPQELIAIGGQIRKTDKSWQALGLSERYERVEVREVVRGVPTMRDKC